MNANDLNPSKYLKARDLAGGVRQVTIIDVRHEEVGNPPETKAVMSFKECRPMIVNLTNQNMLISLLGEDTDDWIGKQIELVSMPVNFKGDIVPAIRVQPFRKPLPPEAEYGTGDEVPL